MSNRLSSNLLRRARGWAGQLTKLARINAPAHIKKYIHSTVIPNGESLTYRIRVFVENTNPAQKYGSADARAQEYGSGLHAQLGGKAKYPIFPKEKKILAFHWEVADQNPDDFSFLPDGRVILPSVQHPGIKAVNNEQGYIRPAIKEIRARLEEELDETIQGAISFDMRNAFKNAKKL